MEARRPGEGLEAAAHTRVFCRGMMSGMEWLATKATRYMEAAQKKRFHIHVQDKYMPETHEIKLKGVFRYLPGK